MHLNPAVFDVWVFRQTATGVEYLLLQTSELKANRYFNGGRFWQIPSGVFLDGETVTTAVDRVLAANGLKDGLRSVREYVTGPSAPAPELCLRAGRPTA